jgi:predicted phosphodiesterase
LGVDQVICLGDVATLGPRPRAIIQMLRDLRCACILGNHDAFMLDPALIHTYTEIPIVVEAVDWCRQQLAKEDLDFLRTFKLGLDITVDADSTILLFHGSPRSHMEDMLATTPADELDLLLGDRRATVMAGGHTHIQMLRQHRGSLLLNPGSVGCPFKEYVAHQAPTLLPHAEYATVDIAHGAVDVRLRRLPLDKRALRDAAVASDNPLAGMLVQQYA